MNLAVWAERNGVARVSAYRWFHAGLLPVPAQRVGRLIVVDGPVLEESRRGRTVVYARVSSADQRSDLDRGVARVMAWATTRQLAVDKVVSEVGSALNGHRRKFLALLRDPAVTRIVVGHRDRFCRFGSEYVQAALAARGRELVVVDSAEVGDDLVRGMTQILTLMCARLSGKRAAQNRAKARPCRCGRGRGGSLMARFEVPEGWCVQALRFTLDPTEGQARALARHFGARRKAYNWTVATVKAGIEAWHVSGVGTDKPSLPVLRKWWNTVKNEVCVNAETGQVWWAECSKEAYADGIGGAVDGYWNWQNSRSGKREGKTMGFARFKKKGRDQDRVTFTTGAMRVEPDRSRHTAPALVLQDGLVRVAAGGRRPLVPVVENLSRLPACAGHRVGRKMAMRRLFGHPPA
jgi:putative transposase